MRHIAQRYPGRSASDFRIEVKQLAINLPEVPDGIIGCPGTGLLFVRYSIHTQARRDNNPAQSISKGE
jgi:hypothetical protein